MSRSLSIRGVNRLLAGWAALALSAMPVAAQTIEVEPPAGLSVAPGAQVEVPIEVDMTGAGGLTLASLQFELSWDPAWLTYVSATPSAPTGWAVTLDETQVGAGVLGVDLSSATGATESFTAIRVVFEAADLQGQWAALDLNVTAAADASGGDLLAFVEARSRLVCIALTAPLGDAIDDGVVNIIDAQQVARYAIGLETPNAPYIEYVGDANEDGLINIIDAQQIARYAVGLETPNSPNLGEPLPGCGNQAPTAEITSPADGSSYSQGETITFSGTCTDPEDGSVVGDALVWTSSLDGQIGTGESFSRSDLSLGDHLIVLTATDSDGATDADTVTITVGGLSIEWDSFSPRLSWSFYYEGGVLAGGTTYKWFIVNLGSGDVQIVVTERGTAESISTVYSVEEGRRYRVTLRVDFNGTRSASAGETCAVFDFSSPSASEITWSTSSAFGEWPNYYCPESFTLTSLVVDDAVASVTVSPDQATIGTGETEQFAATMYDADGNQLDDRHVFWSSSDIFVATVDGNGLATGVGVGSANITANCEGISDAATLTVVENQSPTATIDSPADGATYDVGETISFSGSGTDPEDGPLTGGALVWTSSLEGQIGTGESFTRSDLSVGGHTIVLTATDGNGASDTETVSITVNPGVVPGEWQAPTGFGQFALTVNPEGTGITEITYNFDHWTCGLTGDEFWYGDTTVTRAYPGWPITNGQFTIENTLDPNLTMTVSGTFTTGDQASGTWTGVSFGTTCSGSWDGNPATKLFLRYDGVATTFLSTEQDPSDNWISYDLGVFTTDFAATLDDPISGNTYTFWLWLRADAGGVAGGDFDVSLLLDQSGSETALASTTITVPANEAVYPFFDTVTGISAGAPGDQLILRITHYGEGWGEEFFGRDYDSHVVLPGHVTVSMPSASAVAAAEAQSRALAAPTKGSGTGIRIRSR